MSFFRGCLVAVITRGVVQRWFAPPACTSAAADRSLPILALLLRQAAVYSHRPEEGNPCAGPRRYRRRGWKRFLTISETGRLGEALAALEPETPLPAAVVHPLLVIGCRQGEIRSLQWQDYREGHLFLAVLAPSVDDLRGPPSGLHHNNQQVAVAEPPGDTRV